MYTSDQLLSRVKTAMRDVKLQGNPQELYAPIAYTLNLGGKRIRPVMVLMACDMFGGDIEPAVNAAVAIEIFHNYTLLHDDIMDNAPIRRGQETVFKKWNANVAILSGDAMFALAYKYLSSSRSEVLHKVLNIFTHTAIEVCEGQQYDMNFEIMNNVTIPDYIEMIRLKTAVLIAASLKTGAVIAGASKEDIENIYKFGENVGIAFQLQDDLLDVYGDQDKFGKKIGGDIVTNKKTYMYIKALQQAKAQDNKKLLGYFSASGCTDNKEKVTAVTEIYNRLEVKESAISLIREYYDKAHLCFNNISVSDENKAILKEYTNRMVSRSY